MDSSSSSSDDTTSNNNSNNNTPTAGTTNNNDNNGNNNNNNEEEEEIPYSNVVSEEESDVAGATADDAIHPSTSSEQQLLLLPESEERARNNDNNNVDNDENSIISLTNNPRLSSNNNNNRHQNHSNSSSSSSSSLWITLIVSVMMGFVSGSLYGFGRYSRSLRDALHVNQYQMEKFGILLDNGNYIGHPVTGLFYDYMGPKVSCCMAAIIVFVSYGTIHLCLHYHHSQKESSNLLLWLIDIAFFGVGLGGGLGYIAALGSTTKVFYKSKPRFVGRAIGLVSTGFGFSSTLVGITYYFVGLNSFFLLWAFLVAIVNIIGAITFTNPNNNGNQDQTVNNTTTQSQTSSPSQPNSSSLLSTQHHTTESTDEERNLTEENGGRNSLEEPLLPSSNTENNYESTASPLGTNVATTEQQQPPSWKTWRRLDFWQLFVAYACITGCGLFVINNISTMVQSIGEPDQFAGSLVFMLSLFNVSGRFVVGILSDIPGDAFGRNDITKLTLLRYAALLMSVGLVTSATLSSPVDDDDDVAASTRLYGRLVLTTTVAFVAIAYGSCWVLIVGILADLYGKSHFGKDYGLIAMGPALSGLIFNSVSAWLYQRHANDDGVCVGNRCYQTSFFFTAGAALAGYSLLSCMPSSSSTPRRTGRATTTNIRQ